MSQLAYLHQVNVISADVHTACILAVSIFRANMETTLPAISSQQPRARTHSPVCVMADLKKLSSSCKFLQIPGPKIIFKHTVQFLVLKQTNRFFICPLRSLFFLEAA